MLELICLIPQDDIMKMSNTLEQAEQARNGSQKIDELLKQKFLSLNYDKNKYKLGLSCAKLSKASASYHLF